MREPTLEENIDRVFREKHNERDTPEFRTDEMRLRRGEPVEYILGYADFLGSRIDLADRPMIPRYETAFWVERAIQEVANRQSPVAGKTTRIADTFAGSGNVGTAILKHVPHATVEFFELDEKLLPGIARTLTRNDIDHRRAKVIAANALDGLTGTYDAIFAVPPYVPREALPDLDPEMRDFEPHLAFFAEEGGRAFHRLLVERAWDFLNEGGTLYVETDFDHEEGTRKMLGGTKWSKVEFWPDPYGATPNVVLRK